MAEKEKILAIDIGGTSIKIGVIYEQDVIESTSIRNTFKGKCEDLIPGIYDICNYYVDKYQIKKMGIGCPGDIFDGIVLWAANLGWKNYRILESFSSYFPHLEIKVENDGNAACLAELKFGQLKNINNGIFMTIGRGIGGSIIVNHKILHGSHSYGGKIGHMVIHSNGRKCNCGRRGCFETYGSVLGLIQTVKECNEKASKDEIIDISKLSGFQIVQHCKNGNYSVKYAVKKWHKDIAEGLLNLCNIIDPSFVVIAGGITDSGLIDINYIKNYLSRFGYNNCDVKLATFKGKTGLVGASLLFD